MSYWGEQRNQNLFLGIVAFAVCGFKCPLVTCLCGGWINLCEDEAFLNLISSEVLKEL